MKVAAFTGTEDNPSSRFRIRQYMTELKLYDIEVEDYISSFGTYAPPQKAIRPFWGVANLVEHFFQVMSSRKSDVAFVQREMLATFYTNERFIKVPVILDVDDAIFLLRGGSASRKLALKSHHIICGNTFLADWFCKYNSNISIINTGVDTSHFYPKYASPNSQVIGWSGSSSGLQYLYQIEDALKAVLRRFPKSILRIISDKPPKASFLSSAQVQYFKWSEHEEVSLLQDLRVGIMPLNNDDWAKGKCSFKMLTYMACGIPTVVSPVGMNEDVLREGTLGLPASSISDWVDAISFYLSDEEASQKHGMAGRQIVKNKFSHKIISRQLSQIFDAYKR